VSPARFVLDLRVGPRTVEMAKQLLSSVAEHCRPEAPPLIMTDDHRAYPQAILSIFGLIRHRRRKRRRGRRKQAGLKPAPGLLVGIVKKVRDASGNFLGVKTRRLFGRLKAIRKRIRQCQLGRQISTAHVERINGTIRTQQARLARRTRNVSRDETRMQSSLSVWRDLYHWTRLHTTLRDRTPAMALGLAGRLWTVVDYVRQPVHVGDLQRALWAETKEMLLTRGLYREKPLKTLPTS
jgi:IS1 family transposase